MIRGDGTSLAVISPHLDDAVLGCAGLLDANPGATVVTVFGGLPEQYRGATEWDRQSGFASSVEAMRRRREEDRAALQAVRAEPWHLDYLDSQYGVPASPADVASAIERSLDTVGADRVVVPLGLFHSDHVLTRQAAEIDMRYGRRQLVGLRGCPLPRHRRRG